MYKKYGTNTEPHKGSNSQQRINNNRTAAFEQKSLPCVCMEKQYNESLNIDAIDQNTRLKN